MGCRIRVWTGRLCEPFSLVGRFVFRARPLERGSGPAFWPCRFVAGMRQEPVAPLAPQLELDPRKVASSTPQSPGATKSASAATDTDT